MYLHSPPLFPALCASAPLRESSPSHCGSLASQFDCVIAWPHFDQNPSAPTRHQPMKTIPLILLLLSLCHPWTAFALSPVDLTCEYRHNPIGIDAPSPRLSWKLEATQRNQAQGAYHLLVASTPELLSAGTGDLWDTGRVGSKQSIQIQYNGLPLEPGQTCY